MTPRRALAAVTAALLLALTGCAPASGHDAIIDPRLTGRWLLVGAHDDRGLLHLNGSYLSLDVGDAGAAHGTTPCEDYRARVTGGSGAVFLSVTQGHADCIEQGVATLNSRYFRALREVTVARRSGGDLELSSPSARLEFRRRTVAPLEPLMGVTWLLDQLPPQLPRLAGGSGVLHQVAVRFIAPDLLRISSPCSETLVLVTTVAGSSTVAVDGVLVDILQGEQCTPDQRNAAGRRATC